MATTRSTRRWLIPLLILLITAAFLLPGLGRQVMSREQELRVALTARTMVTRGDWVRPEYLGEPRLRKPPLMYWAVATAYRITGETASAAVARLPSALAGLALVSLLYFLTAAPLGRRRAAVSALVCGTSFIFLKQARLAETDVLLALGTTGAALALYHALTTRNRLWWWLAGAAAGLGFMAKGPAAIVLPLAAALLYTALAPSVRTAWRTGHAGGALMLALMLILPWYVAILNDATALAQVRDEVKRAAVTSEHPGSVFYYTYTLLHAMLPWGLALPFALVHGWRQRHRPPIRFALAWLGSSFLVLSLMDSKQIHYALLMVPPGSLLVGHLLGSTWAGRAGPRRTANRILTAFLGGGLLGGVTVLALAWCPAFALPKLPILGCGLIAAACSFAGLRTSSRGGRGLGLLGALLALAWGASNVVMPLQARERIVPEALQGARSALKSAPRVMFHGPRNAIAEFYADRELVMIDDPAKSWARAGAGEVLVVVTRGEPPLPPRLPVPPDYAAAEARWRCDIWIKP